MTTRIGIKIKKEDNEDNRKKFSSASSYYNMPKENQLSNQLDKLYGTNLIKDKQYFTQPLTKIKANFNPDYDVNN